MKLLLNASLPVGVFALALVVTPHALAQEPDSASALTWLGQEAAIEQYIIEAEVVGLEDIGTGVTNPKVADFAPGGLVRSCLVQAGVTGDIPGVLGELQVGDRPPMSSTSFSSFA